MQRIFSGIQPSGVPTLGNYLGALRNWVALQDGHECIYCVVDLHAITHGRIPPTLPRRRGRWRRRCWPAGSTRPHILFQQSAVQRHVRLGWIFNCVARLGWLNRMTQFKDKAGKDQENVSAGLYVYPNLMAADILAYHATRVPVGDDQRQHLELANDIAQKFNHDYGVEFFPPIEPLILGEAARVMSLRDGTKKMSKSDPSDQSRINLTDDADTIALKIRRAKTDPEPLPESAAGLDHRPEARNLVGIYRGPRRTPTLRRADRPWRQGVRRVQGSPGRAAGRQAGADRAERPGAAGRSRHDRPPAARGRRARGGDRRTDRGRSRTAGWIP